MAWYELAIDGHVGVDVTDDAQRINEPPTYSEDWRNDSNWQAFANIRTELDRARNFLASTRWVRNGQVDTIGPVSTGNHQPGPVRENVAPDQADVHLDVERPRASIRVVLGGRGFLAMGTVEGREPWLETIGFDAPVAATRRALGAFLVRLGNVLRESGYQRET